MDTRRLKYINMSSEERQPVELDPRLEGYFSDIEQLGSNPLRGRLDPDVQAAEIKAIISTHPEAREELLEGLNRE
jgi:hypothetical protein